MVHHLFFFFILLASTCFFLCFLMCMGKKRRKKKMVRPFYILDRNKICHGWAMLFKRFILNLTLFICVCVRVLPLFVHRLFLSIECPAYKKKRKRCRMCGCRSRTPFSSDLIVFLDRRNSSNLAGGVYRLCLMLTNKSCRWITNLERNLVTLEIY